jgi:hypothetical protein
MSDKKCPQCGWRNPTSTIRCKCGYDFVTGTKRKSFMQYYEEDQSPVIQEIGKKNMLYGALWCMGGIIVTTVTYIMAGEGGTYIVTWGAIVFGAFQFFKGFVQYNR